MDNVSKLIVRKKKDGQRLGTFIYFRRVGVTLFRDADGLHKPGKNFRELYELYKKSEKYEIEEHFDPVTQLELRGKIVL